MYSTDNLISADEAAHILGVNRATVLRWKDAGRLDAQLQAPGLRGAFLFAEEDVRKLAEERAA